MSSSTMTICRTSAASLLLVAMTVAASAQQTGGQNLGAGGGTNTGGAASELNVGGDATLGTSLDPEQAFNTVERGDTIGSTGATGESFGIASSASPTGGGGIGGGLGGLGGGLGALGNFFNSFNQGGGQASKPLIRTRLRSAVAVAPTPPAMVGQVATQRFRSLSSRPGLRGINVVMRGRTAVITGVVRNQSERRMSEMLMRLEPGVSRIDNQIEVVPEIPSPSDIIAPSSPSF